MEPQGECSALDQSVVVFRPIGGAVSYFLRRRILGRVEESYFWHSTGPSGGDFGRLATSKFAFPVLFIR